MTAPRVLLITGGNSGVGYEAVKAFLQSNVLYHVFLASRSMEQATSAIEAAKKEAPETKSTVEPLVLDVNSDDSIDQAVEAVKTRTDHIDVLVNNAGATWDMDFAEKKIGLRECFNKAYDTNVTGTHVTTWKFMPLLLKSSDPRLLFSAGLSMMSQAQKNYFPTPPQPAGWPKEIDFETIGYRCSKTALNMLMLDWSFKLRADGVKVWAVGPGFLATNLGGRGPEYARKMGAGHPSAGGIMYRSVVEGEWDHLVNNVIGKNGVIPF